MLNDLRYAIRNLRRNPGFALLAVTTMALGLGANVAVFSLVRAVILAPLPIPEADRLVTIWERRPGSRDTDLPISGHEFVAWQQQNRVFERMALHRGESLDLTGSGDPEAIDALRVSIDYFELFRLRPVLGRVFVAGEDAAGSDAAVILSDGFWRRRFGGDPDMVGKTVLLNDRSHAVIGVMSPLAPSLAPDAWLPLDVAAQARTVGRHNLAASGRLLRGVSLAQALALVGIFGVVSYTVLQRTREIGVRVALGADRREIVGMVVWQGMRPISVGVGLGATGALLLTRFIQNLLFGIEPTDPLTFAGTAALLSTMALVACWLPAKRAAGLDPVRALRAE